MAWKCFLVDEGSFDLPVGAMWFGPMPSGPGGQCIGGELADEYYRDHWPNRAPIIVMMPAKNEAGKLFPWPFCVDVKQSSDPRSGWKVSGEAPDITVSPSIHAIGVYHGWLTGGVISDG